MSIHRSEQLIRILWRQSVLERGSPYVKWLAAKAVELKYEKFVGPWLEKELQEYLKEEAENEQVG